MGGGFLANTTHKLYHADDKRIDKLDIKYFHWRNPIVKLLFAFKGLNIIEQQIQTSFQTNIRVSKEKPKILSQEDINIIVVIGESFIKHHSSLYGYYLQTNPFLEKEKLSDNLFVFNDVVTTASRTSESLKNLFSCNSYSLGESFSNFPLFTVVFKSANYNVYMWDNQTDFASTQFATATLNSFLYNKDIYSISYTQTNNKTFAYDEDLIKDFKHQQLANQGNNLLIFHLMGQHNEARERFPKSFAKFSYKDIKHFANYLNQEKMQMIADYDNATFYNDYVIEQIIDLYRDKNTVIVYFSDHGEEMFDYRDAHFRPGCLGDWYNFLKYQYEVPFFIWCSDKYKELHPETIKQINDAVNKPFAIDNLCHILFYFANIDTKYYKQERNILTDKYKTVDRMTDNKINYDSVMRTKH